MIIRRTKQYIIIRICWTPRELQFQNCSPGAEVSQSWNWGRALALQSLNCDGRPRFHFIAIAILLLQCVLQQDQILHYELQLDFISPPKIRRNCPHSVMRFWLTGWFQRRLRGRHCCGFTGWPPWRLQWRHWWGLSWWQALVSVTRLWRTGWFRRPVPSTHHLPFIFYMIVPMGNASLYSDLNVLPWWDVTLIILLPRVCCFLTFWPLSVFCTKKVHCFPYLTYILLNQSLLGTKSCCFRAHI
jgi:hypothetical protein